MSPAFPTDKSGLPAVLCCDENAGLQIAGLTLLDRLAVAVHRGGCRPVIIVAGKKVATPRASAIGAALQFVDTIPDMDGPALVGTTSILVQASVIRALLASGGRLIDANGRALPIGVAPHLHGSVEDALRPLAPVMAANVACRITGLDSAKEAERSLWASLISASDGLVDRLFNRPAGRPLSKLLVHTPISPNAISLTSILVGVAAGALFAVGEYTASVAGAILFQLSAILDCVDGDIARVMFKESALGKWLDLAGDQVVHIGVFGGIALGLMKTTPAAPALWLGLSAISGALLSFAVVVRGLRRPQLDRSGRLKKLINAATNRDFSVLVLFLALWGHLDLFLWVTAVGSHVFWMTALALQLGGRSAEARAQ